MDTIFKVGDRVYEHAHGWGTVNQINHSSCKYPVQVVFDNQNSELFTKTGQVVSIYPAVLSFTKYDLVMRGFSQKRPLPQLEKDTLVYVKTSCGWDMRFFSHFQDDILCFFINQRCSADNSPSTQRAMHWSLTNPLTEGISKEIK